MATVADHIRLKAANRQALGNDIVRAVQDVTFSGSMESAPMLQVVISDPDDDLLRSNLMVRRAERVIGSPQAFTLRPIDLIYRGIPYRLSDTDHEGAFTTLEFEHRGVAYMRRHDEPISASRNATTRALFIRRQVMEVGRRRSAPHKMAFWAPELRVRQPIASVDENVSENAEADRDIGSTREGAQAFKDLEVKGRKADAEQRRNMALAFAAVADEDVPRKALVAMALAPIGENAWRSGKNAAGSGATGPFQVMPRTAAGLGVSLTDFGMHARIFLVGMPSGRYKGKSFTGGPPAATIARQNPGISAAEIVDRVEGGGAGAAFYGEFIREAEAIVDAAGGILPDSSAGSYTKQYRFKRDKGEDGWESTGRLAEEVGRRRFVTVIGEKQDVFIYAGDVNLLALRPQASFSPDDPEVIGFDYGLTMGKTARTARVRLRTDSYGLSWGLPVLVEGGGPPGGKWLVWDVTASSDSPTVEMELRQPQPVRPEPASERVQRSRGDWDREGGDIGTKGGARGIVDQIFRVAKDAGGPSLYVGSDYRAGSITASGGTSDHSSNDASRAARDIGKRGVDLITGPWPKELARATVAVGRAFGKDYGNGTDRVVDTFTWKGYRIQLIAATPEYGGHLGHLHAGARRA